MKIKLTPEILELKAQSMNDLVSKNVRKFRKLKSYTQLDLALEIGLSGNGFIARAEKRKKDAKFNVEHLVKISAILKIGLDNFFVEHPYIDMDGKILDETKFHRKIYGNETYYL